MHAGVQVPAGRVGGRPPHTSAFWTGGPATPATKPPPVRMLNNTSGTAFAARPVHPRLRRATAGWLRVVAAQATLPVGLAASILGYCLLGGQELAVE